MPVRPPAALPPPAADGPRPNDRPAGASDETGRVAYPEWDAGAGRHRPYGATVVLARAPEGDGAWADAILRDHAAVVRRVRQRFEPLRARRARLPRQRFGEEVDLAACVDALVDRRAGRAADDRLYVAVRPVDAFIRVRPPLLLHTDACLRAPPPPVYTVCELCRCRFLVRHTSPLGA